MVGYVLGFPPMNLKYLIINSNFQTLRQKFRRILGINFRIGHNSTYSYFINVNAIRKSIERLNFEVL